MTTVETAPGSLATAQLGPTLMHEHIVTRSPELFVRELTR